MPETHSTLEHIHIAAKKEFLEKGFRSASLRNIVKSAGVTTGAFYGYYSSKEELFAALVDEHYKYLLTKYKQSLSGFEELSPKRQTERMGSVGKGQRMYAGNARIYALSPRRVSPDTALLRRNTLLHTYR